MRFSWTGVILAPLLVPLLFSVVMPGLMGASSPGLGFLLLLIPGCLVSYATMVFLFLPALFLLSLRQELTGLKVCLLGLMLGAAVLVPLTLMAWKSSGPDSGPPVDSFFVFFLRFSADPTTAFFPLAGLVTAGFYWWLVTRRQGQTPIPK
jgi:hypothetical protein